MQFYVSICKFDVPKNISLDVINCIKSFLCFGLIRNFCAPGGVEYQVIISYSSEIRLKITIKSGRPKTTVEQRQ